MDHGHLSDGAKELLIGGAQPGVYGISASEGMGWWRFSVGDRDLYHGSEQRDIAKWRGAIKELERSGLIEFGGGDYYHLTERGFAAADELNKE